MGSEAWRGVASPGVEPAPAVSLADLAPSLCAGTCVACAGYLRLGTGLLLSLAPGRGALRMALRLAVAHPDPRPRASPQGYIFPTLLCFRRLLSICYFLSALSPANREKLNET